MYMVKLGSCHLNINKFGKIKIHLTNMAIYSILMIEYVKRW